MHIVECYLECGGFDFRLLKGGISVYLWNLSRRFGALGHRVSLVTASHGQLGYLRSRYPVVDLPYRDRYELPLPLDPRIWRDYPTEVSLPLETTAHLVKIDGVDVYVLDNEMLAQYPESYYPPYECKGTDLSFFKPLVFQIDAVRFIRRHLLDDETLVHLHEPYYHYLMPRALRASGARVVSTVQSNMPVNKKVYRPEVERLLQFLGVNSDTQELGDPPLDGALIGSMRQHLPSTHLYHNYPDDYVSLFALVVRDADLVDFLSVGQRNHYVTQRDTPFEQLYRQLNVSRLIRSNANKIVVGGCAIGNAWLREDHDTDRFAVLTSLGLEPTRPTLYHNARYAVDHKGQVELIRAVDRLLAEDEDVNVIIRCMSSAGIPDPLFHAVAARYAGRVHLEWEPIDEASLRARARSSDICVFPSKFELDTFLIAQGEAMACGAVPVASAQEGMRHYCHHLPLDDPASTGFAVNRSFIADDPRLVEALVRRLREALSVLREDPTTWGRLRRTATATARTFTWEACADRLLGYFTALLEGRPRSCGVDDLLAWGWFEELPEDAWLTRRADIAVRATELGDLGAYRRCAEVDEAAARRLFEAAFCRGDIPACAGIVEEFDLHDLRDVLAARCCVTSNDGCLNVVYRHPFGERVEVFTPEASEDSGPRWRRHELAFEDGSFWGTLAEAPSSGVLPVLLTLRDGRATWDEVSYG